MKQLTFSTTYRPLDETHDVDCKLRRFTRSPFGWVDGFFAESFSIIDHDEDGADQPAEFRDVFVIVTRRPDDLEPDDDPPDSWTFSLYDDHGNDVIDFDRDSDENCTIKIANGRLARSDRRIHQ